MPAHTPGPWTVEHPFRESGVYVAASDTGLVCKVYYPQDNGESNARLIAAAPALLEALEDALTQLNDDDCGECLGCRARAAIAQVKGETV